MFETVSLLYDEESISSHENVLRFGKKQIFLV